MCHNCGSTMKLGKFIKVIDPLLYSEYQLESFVDKGSSSKKKETVSVQQFITKPVFKNVAGKIETNHLTKIKALPPEFYARKYLEDRKVPIDDLYFASDFSEYVKSQFPNYDKKLYKEARIVIPFYDRDNNLLGVQEIGRAHV